MSGHSKWATIKRAKGKTDAARGKLFGRLIKEITVAAKSSGDIDGNPRLRAAVATAKSNNMPSKNIEAAIARGSGTAEGANYEEIVFEGYAPAGVAVVVECLTDNRNRTVGEVRHAFTKYGGSLGTTNSVLWMFARKGVIEIDKAAIGEDELMELALEAGAEDISTLDEVYEVTTPPDAFEPVRSAIEAKKVSMLSAEISKVPENTVTVTGDGVGKVMKLIGVLDDLDDVQNVFSNFDASDEDMEAAQE